MTRDELIALAKQTAIAGFDRKKWTREYFLSNKEKINENRRARWAKDPEKYRAAGRKRNHVGRYAAYGKKYREENHGKLLEAERRRRDGYKTAVFELLGNKCCRCGFADERALQVDHINRADAKTHGKNDRSGFPLYRAIVIGTKQIDLFQLLCANCNWIKRFENGEHCDKRRTN